MSNDLFQVSSDHQPRAFGIDRRYAIVEGRRSEVASGRGVRDGLQLCEFRRRYQDVAGDPDINWSGAGFRFSRLGCLWIFHPPHWRRLTRATQLLYFRVKERVEIRRILQFSQHYWFVRVTAVAHPGAHGNLIAKLFAEFLDG